jgi:hypothetical protein
VTPLDHLPVVESGGSAKEWLDTNLSWWESENYWPVELALNGPPNWPRAPVGTLVPPSQAVPVEPTTVTDARTTNSGVSFNVGRLGAPVLVKVPYFPNWHATGALGPYEVSPNLMAVVPTAHHVTLTYGTTAADQLGKLASLGGVVGLCMLMTLRPPVVSKPPSTPEPSPPTRDDAPEGGAPSRLEDETEPIATVAVQELHGPSFPEPGPEPGPDSGRAVSEPEDGTTQR